MARKFRPLGHADLERFTDLKSGLDQVETELQLRGPWNLPEDYTELSSRRDSLYDQLSVLLDNVVV